LGRTAGDTVGNRRRPVSSFDDPEWAKRFHVWLTDCDEDRMTIAVDGLMLNDTDLNSRVYRRL
jgi:hypothetical protein